MLDRELSPQTFIINHHKQPLLLKIKKILYFPSYLELKMKVDLSYEDEGEFTYKK